MKTITVYKCANGALEEKKERAIAWDLHHLVKSRSGHEHLNFSGALCLIENRKDVINLLKEMDDETVSLEV